MALAQTLGGASTHIEVGFVKLSTAMYPPAAADDPPEEAPPSSWDPPVHMEMMEASRCRALLLEIIRRAAHDWVLYRTHTRAELRECAEDAFTWLFEEDQDHPSWRLRKKDGYTITAFLTICDVLDLDPSFVRREIRKMTPKQIMTAGRPPERRSRPTEEPHYREHAVSETVSLNALDGDESQFSSSYEAHYAVYTSD